MSDMGGGVLDVFTQYLNAAHSWHLLKNLSYY